jgi:hypothetical protein
MAFCLDSFRIPPVRVMDRNLDSGRLLYYSGYFRRHFEQAQKALISRAETGGQPGTFKLFIAFFSAEPWPPSNWTPKGSEIGRLFEYAAEFDVPELMATIARNVKDYLSDQDFLRNISSQWLPRLMVEAKKARVDGWADAVLDALESFAEALRNGQAPDHVQELRVKALGLFDGLTRDDVRQHHERVEEIVQAMGLGALKVL